MCSNCKTCPANCYEDALACALTQDDACPLLTRDEDEVVAPAE